MIDSKATAVLVHGAWADGSSWARVVTRLRDAGVASVAAPLPLTSFADDAAALERTLERVEGPVVLAGHAYGGAVMAAGRNPKIQALAYIAALAPDEGETVAEVFYRALPHPLSPKLEPDTHGLIWLPQDAFGAAFAPDATPEEQAVLFAVQRPISPACITVPVERPLWKDRPSWFLVAERDRMIPPETQTFLAARMGATVRHGAFDHAPLITAPDAVAALILEAIHDGSVTPATPN
jgi:pimeloyl-ACP methyl ester carboxylesterase